MNQFDLSMLSEHAIIHFVGIGGISMSGLAQMMLKKGFRVSGSDRTESEMTDKLAGMGAVIYIGHRAEQVHGADLVVHTAAVHSDNPELSEAARLSIPTIDRAALLGAVMKQFGHAVGVSGTHGKTTTPSMLAHALVYAGTDPTISLGGELDLIGGNVRLGDSDYFVTEACEYTNSFLKFFPTIALITNIDADHLDFFHSLEEIIESFRKFALLTKGRGCVIACSENENVKKALKDLDLDICYYGFSEEDAFYAQNIRFEGGFPAFDVFSHGKRLCGLQLGVAGEHNILNALAAVAVCDRLGIDPETTARGIETFHGVHRRFEKKGMYHGAAVIDDYAHHPTEIRATLKAARSFPETAVKCVFQPHTYSRTRLLWEEFVECFDLADELIVTDIYAAREEPDGVTDPEKLAEEIKKRGVNAHYMKTFAEIEDYLRNTLSEGDMLLTVGAGDVYKIGEALL